MVAVVATTVFGLPGKQAAAAANTFVVSPASQSVDLSAGTVQVDVQVQDVSNMAAFQFLLRYDRGVLSDPTATVGAFPGSAGQSPECPGQVVDGPEGPGTILFGCATIGQTQGVSGSGTLATVTFRLSGGAQTVINVERTTLTTSIGDDLCTGWCPARGATVTVNGGDPTKDFGLSSTPTPAPQPTDVPTSTSGQPTPTAAGAGGATPPAGVSSGNSGDGPEGAGGAAGGNDTAGGAGSPSGVLGNTGQRGGGASGPPASAGSGNSRIANLGGGPSPQGGRPYGILASSMALGLLGAGLLMAGGRRVRRRAIRDR